MNLKTEYNKETGKEQRNWLEGGTYDDEYVHWLHEKYFELIRKLEDGQHETIVMCPLCKETDLTDISIYDYSKEIQNGERRRAIASFQKCPNCHIVLSDYGT